MLSMIDKFLNRITMYKLVLYCLIAYVLLGLILSITSSIGVLPRGIIMSTVVLLIVMYAANRGIAQLLNISVNQESWLISALILVCILPPEVNANGVIKLAITGIIAIASKFFLRWKGVNLFNPAAFAALFVSVAHILPVTWWVGTPAMIPITVVGGLLILRKTRRFSLELAFLIMAIVLACYVDTLLGHQALTTTMHEVLLSSPLLFMGTIMLTEPSTLPSTRLHQMYYGLLVGTVYSSALSAGRFTSSPQAALIIGNIFTIFVVARFGSQLILKQRTELGPHLYDLAFSVPEGQKLSFRPGQYLEWTLPHASPDFRGNRRTFSIASCPSDQEVHIGIKTYELSSSFKKALLSLKPGQTIRASRPAGDFVLPDDPRQSLVLIAGGIGITPFIAMIKDVIANGHQRKITLVYLAASQAEFAYTDIFKEAEKYGVNTHYVTQRLQPDDLNAYIKSEISQQFYISGPDGLVRSYKSMLLKLHVSMTSIHTDYFSGY
jgi:ferredoxin-NADP reductase/Na+-translocating ferredoxin:NAD+ oxidoreductase RnfD subunit